MDQKFIIHNAHLDNPLEFAKFDPQLRSKDLSQIAKYNNGIILTKNNQPGLINNVKTMPLALKLLEF